jgi:hypothetical protein
LDRTKKLDGQKSWMGQKKSDRQKSWMGQVEWIEKLDGTKISDGCKKSDGTKVGWDEKLDGLDRLKKVGCTKSWMDRTGQSWTDKAQKRLDRPK